MASIFGSVANAASIPPGRKAPPEGSNFGQPPSYGNASFFNYCQDGYDAQGRFGYFSSIFYDRAGFDGATSGLYKRELNDHYGMPAAPGLFPDDNWSAAFDTTFVVTNGDTTPGEIYLNKLYPTYAGTFRAIVYDVSNWNVVFDSGTSYRQATPKEFGPEVFSTNEEKYYHMTIEYESSNVDDPTLILNAMTCDEYGMNCTPKSLFYVSETAPIRLEQLYYSKMPADVFAGVDKIATFDISYQTKPLGVDIQWARDPNSGFVDIPGEKNPVLNWLVGQNNHGNDFEAKISNGVCQLVDVLPFGRLYVTGITPTPTPTPGTGALQCTTTNGTDTITITDGDYAIFAASDYTSAPTFETCQQAVPNYQNNGADTFNATFHLPTDSGSGYCEPAPVKNLVKVTSFNETAYCYVVIEKKICLTDCETPTPPPGGEISQNSTMYAYEFSPIDPLDQGRSPYCTGTPDFPKECDPYPVAGQVKIVKSSKGLIWRTDKDVNNLFTVTSNNKLTVKDSKPNDDNNASFDYPTIFKSGNKNDDLSTQVGQIMAYITTIRSLTDFNNYMWPLGPSSGDPFKPAGSQFENFAFDVKVVDDPRFCIVDENNGRPTIVLRNICALEQEVVSHELFHVFELFLSNFSSNKDPKSSNFEFGGLNEGLADYFALRRSDAQYIGDYIGPLRGGGDAYRKVLANSDLGYRYFYKILGMDPYGDNHFMGSQLANILLQMRNQIPANDANRKVFDKAIVNSYEKTALKFGGFNTDLTISVFQQFYIQLYANLQQAGFSYLDYFLNDLVYGKAKIGAGLGSTNYESLNSVIIKRDPSNACIDDGTGRKNPLYAISLPSIAAVGSEVAKVTLSFKDSANPSLMDDYVFSTNSASVENRLPILPAGTPIYFNTKIPLSSDTSTKKIYATVTAKDGKTGASIRLFDTFNVDRTGCD